MTDLSHLDFPFRELECADDEVRKFSTNTRPRADKIIAAMARDYPHANVRETVHGKKTFYVSVMKYADTVFRIAGL